jgi:hypothetical protein
MNEVYSTVNFWLLALILAAFWIAIFRIVRSYIEKIDFISIEMTEDTVTAQSGFDEKSEII